MAKHINFFIIKMNQIIKIPEITKIYVKNCSVIATALVKPTQQNFQCKQHGLFSVVQNVFPVVL